VRIPSDSDSNGLPDEWELKYFGIIGNDPNSSPDGNGYTLLQDYQAGADPTNYYSQPNPGGSGAIMITPTLSYVSGSRQVSTAGHYTDEPLVVQLANSSGGVVVLPHAPVTFTASAGQVVATGGTPGATATALADANGQARCFFKQPTTNGATSTITASIGSLTPVTFTESTSAGDGTFDSPTGITVTRVSETEMDLTWVNHASAAKGIWIVKSTDHGTTWSTVTILTDITATSYAVTGLTPGLVYRFAVSDVK